MSDDIQSVLLSEKKILDRVRELGSALSADYAGKDPLFVGILKGSFIFMADLMRYIDIKCSVDFMAVSSYGGSMKTSGRIRVKKDMSEDIAGRHVVIVEDILDSGVTLSHLTALLSERNPASIKIVTLLDKPSRRKEGIKLKADYAGFSDIPNEFVVGYGLDYAENYRNLPYIGVLKPEIYEH